jgi:peptide/nickel transport system substrate-binding protein
MSIIVHAEPRRDEIIWETVGSPESLDPHVNYESFGNWVFYNVYETLYTYSWDSHTPLLASSAPTVSADGLNYTITLQTGVSFHDGTPFNASCVKWNIERAMKLFYIFGPVWMIAEPLKGGSELADIAYSEGPDSDTFQIAFEQWIASSGAIVVLDDYQIRFVLEEPYTPFIAALSTPVSSMMSPTFALSHSYSADWGNYGVIYGDFETYMNEHTCGTGPYMVSQWIWNDRVVLNLNPNYWRSSSTTDAGSIKSVTLKTNEDSNSRILNLQAGEIDGCYLPKEYDWYYELSNDPNILVSTGGTSYTLSFAGFDLDTIRINNTDYISPFNNIHFRKSIVRAFPTDLFIEESLSGFGFQVKSPIPYGMYGHNDAAFIMDYNFTNAVEEWNLAMLDPTFVDALNSLGNEIPLFFPMTSQPPDLFYEILIETMIDLWEHPNANLTGLDQPMDFALQGVSWPEYLTLLDQGALLIYLMGWIPDFADPDNCLQPIVYHKGLYAQRIGYNNTDVNNWFEIQRTTDGADRLQYLDLIQEQIAQDVPYLWLAQEGEFRTWRLWLLGDGLLFDPMHDIYFYNVYKEGVSEDSFTQALRFYLIIGISVELVIVSILIVYRFSRPSRRTSST